MATAPRRKAAAKLGKAVNILPSPATVGTIREQPSVSYLRPDLAHLLPLYSIIRDCLRGETSLKQHDMLRTRGQLVAPFGMSVFEQSNLYQYGSLPYVVNYLPQPNAQDRSTQNIARYRSYIERALFYNVVHNTLEALIGAVFLRAPVIALPTELQPLQEDASGDGVSLIQFAKQVCHYVVAYGRAGILVDYPRTDGPITVAQKAADYLRPTLTLYQPWTIVNWRTRTIGGVKQLSLVVIAENGVVSDDGFKESVREQYRVLRINEAGQYQCEIWYRTDLTQDGDLLDAAYSTLRAQEIYVPTDANGKAFEYIPFTFTGPQDNSCSVDYPPLADLAAINIAHYHNSADYEESLYLVGQPTPVFTGLTTDWVNNVLEGSVDLGSRAAVMLPIGGKAELLQTQPNNMLLEAMQHKEAQMAALGARLVEEKRVQKTATEAGFDEASRQSPLASSANNASQAILWALQQACVFEGVVYTDETLKFELNTEFDLIKPSPESRKQLLTEFEAGAISWSEYRHNMRRSGITTLDDATAAADIKANPPMAAALTLASIEKTATNDRTSP